MGYAYYIIDGRERGYAVEAICDDPVCGNKIDRGLSYLCGDDPYGGPDSCANYFCGEHLLYTARGQRCELCAGLDPDSDDEGEGVLVRDLLSE